MFNKSIERNDNEKLFKSITTAPASPASLRSLRKKRIPILCLFWFWFCRGILLHGSEKVQKSRRRVMPQAFDPRTTELNPTTRVQSAKWSKETRSCTDHSLVCHQRCPRWKRIRGRFGREGGGQLQDRKPVACAWVAVGSTVVHGEAAAGGTVSVGRLEVGRWDWVYKYRKMRNWRGSNEWKMNGRSHSVN